MAAEAAEKVTVETIEQSLDKAAVRYDRSGDQHYDVTSAFIKSIRGSDVDAALHYLARMLEAGEDPRFIARRLMIQATEDIGMADPTALQIAVAAAQMVQLVGLPEAQITLAHATIHLATAPKSNAVIYRDRRGDGRRQGRARPAWYPHICATGTTPGPKDSETRTATSTRTTTRTALCRSSTRRTNWSAWTTTSRPTTAPNGRSRAGLTSCAPSSVRSADEIALDTGNIGS